MPDNDNPYYGCTKETTHGTIIHMTEYPATFRNTSRLPRFLAPITRIGPCAYCKRLRFCRWVSGIYGGRKRLCTRCFNDTFYVSEEEA